MRVFVRLVWLIFPLTAAVLLSATGTLLYLGPKLPSVESLKDVKLQQPLRIFTADGKLMGEFGEMRRTPISYEQVPARQLQAFLAAEDDRFLEHHGIDIPGLMRAALQLVKSGSIQSGGSTITMQVAKNYFLSRERTFIRKFNEILLAIQIERELTKQDIMELYLNKIFLGHRAYGIAAAAAVYYGTSIEQLSLAQQAMLAGLPKAPSALNPLENPSRALERRNWILGRMLKLGNITEADYQTAVNSPVTARYHGALIEVEAGYAAEMARQEMLSRFGRDAYVDGYEVTTTVDSRLQQTADNAVRMGLISYDLRHGYRGPEQTIPPIDDAAPAEQWAQLLTGIPTLGGMQPAIVTRVEETSLYVVTRDALQIRLDWARGLSKARKFITPDYRGPSPKTAAEIAQPGDIIRIRADGNESLFTQIPRAQAALVSIDARDGAIRAVTGGFDFAQSKFNRVTQAQRLPGSNIKPFIYAAAMENGYSPASIINDAPIVFEDEGLEQVWRPENDSGKFYGPTSLRTGLLNSRNLVSIRLLQQLGIDVAVDYLTGLGFPREDLPPNLSLALGTLTTTPLRLVSAYALLANGGYKVEPYLIKQIRNIDGDTVFEAAPLTACVDCLNTKDSTFEEADSLEQLLEKPGTETPDTAPQVMDARAAYMIDSILKDAIQFGTGRRAKALKRNDIAGKTGTTNGPTDAWFSGYVGHVVTTAWLGFDQNQKLGRQEYGGSAALPIWIDYMRIATQDLPAQLRPRPTGLVSVRIDPKTGLLATPGQPDAQFELFPIEQVPQITPNGDEPSNPYVPDEYNSHQIF